MLFVGLFFLQLVVIVFLDNVAQDKDQWQTLLSMIINILVPFKAVDLTV